MSFVKEILIPSFVKSGIIFFIVFIALPLPATAWSWGISGFSKPLFMKKSRAPQQFEVNTSVMCAECHENHLLGTRSYQSSLLSMKHQIGIRYVAQNQNVQNLRIFPRVYLENGKMACVSCHDGYTEHLTNNNTQHLRPYYSKGTQDCSACHDF